MSVAENIHLVRPGESAAATTSQRMIAMRAELEALALDHIDEALVKLRAATQAMVEIADGVGPDGLRQFAKLEADRMGKAGLTIQAMRERL